VSGSFCNLCALAVGLALHIFATVLTSPKKEETAVHCCDPTLSVLVMLVFRNVFHVVSALQSIVWIYTTFILGTALLNFGAWANYIVHGPLDFCRVKANFLARVPKNLGRPRLHPGPPKKRSACRNRRYPRLQSLCTHD